MTLIKLTDENDMTTNNTRWGEDIAHTADGESKELCNDHWIHAYTDIYVAALLNPAHGNYDPYHAWECEGIVGLELPDKCGCTSLTTLKRIDPPAITVEMQREFARFIALEVYPIWQKYDTGGKWLAWAQKPTGQADAAWAAAARAAWAAAWAAAKLINTLTPARMVKLARIACGVKEAK
jgi:hypothetical protein